jgi:hypothetical protein
MSPATIGWRASPVSGSGLRGERSMRMSTPKSSRTRRTALPKSLKMTVGSAPQSAATMKRQWRRMSS